MGSDPAQSEGILVVDLALDEATTPFVELGRGDPGQEVSPGT